MRGAALVQCLTLDAFPLCFQAHRIRRPLPRGRARYVFHNSCATFPPSPSLIQLGSHTLHSRASIAVCPFHAVYLFGLAPLYILTQVVLPRLLPQLEFLPLLLTSVYCTFGTMHAWSAAAAATTALTENGCCCMLTFRRFALVLFIFAGVCATATSHKSWRAWKIARSRMCMSNSQPAVPLNAPDVMTSLF